MEYVAPVIMLLAAIAVIVSFVQNNQKSQTGIDTKRKFSRVVGFKTSEFHIGFNNVAVAIDKEGKKICFLSTVNTVAKPQVFKASDIVECLIDEDGTTITHSKRKNVISRAVVGGVVLGGVGAVVGALSGGSKSTSSQEVNKIQLSIRVNDLTIPTRVIQFSKLPVKKGSTPYRQFKEPCQKWHDMVSVLIKYADQNSLPVNNSLHSIEAGKTAAIAKMTSVLREHIETKSANTKSQTSGVIKIESVADELTKLNELVQQNVLTQEEFEQQKAKLLNA